MTEHINFLRTRGTYKHPCTGCKAYDAPNRPIGKINCPVLNRQITMEACNRIGGDTTVGAWKKVDAIKKAQ